MGRWAVRLRGLTLERTVHPATLLRRAGLLRAKVETGPLGRRLPCKGGHRAATGRLQLQLLLLPLGQLGLLFRQLVRLIPTRR